MIQNFNLLSKTQDLLCTIHNQQIDKIVISSGHHAALCNSCLLRDNAIQINHLQEIITSYLTEQNSQLSQNQDYKKILGKIDFIKKSLNQLLQHSLGSFFNKLDAVKSTLIPNDPVLRVLTQFSPEITLNLSRLLALSERLAIYLKRDDATHCWAFNLPSPKDASWQKFSIQREIVLQLENCIKISTETEPSRFLRQFITLIDLTIYQETLDYLLRKDHLHYTFSMLNKPSVQKEIFRAIQSKLPDETSHLFDNSGKEARLFFKIQTLFLALQSLLKHDFNQEALPKTQAKMIVQTLLMDEAHSSCTRKLLMLLIRQTAIWKEFLQSGANAAVIIKEHDGDFSNQDLRRIELQNVSLDQCNFQGSNLEGSILVRTDIYGCNFTGASLKSARWSQIHHFELRSLAGSDDSILSVSFCQGTDQIVSCGKDGTIRLWDWRQHAQLKEFKGHQGDVTSICLSPRENFLVSGGLDGRVRVWETSSGNQVQEFSNNENCVKAVAYSRDGQRIAAAGGNALTSHKKVDFSVKVWSTAGNLENKTPERLLCGHICPVNSICFSPCSKHLVSGGEDNKLIVWNIESGEVWRTVEGVMSGVSQVAYSYDGSLIASCSSLNNLLIVWDKHFESRVIEMEIEVTALAFGQGHEQFVAVAREDKSILIIDVRSRREIRQLRGHKSKINALSVAEGGQYLVSGSQDLTIKIWSLNSNQERIEADDPWDRFQSLSSSDPWGSAESSRLNSPIGKQQQRVRSLKDYVEGELQAEDAIIKGASIISADNIDLTKLFRSRRANQ